MNGMIARMAAGMRILNWVCLKRSGTVRRDKGQTWVPSRFRTTLVDEKLFRGVLDHQSGLGNAFRECGVRNAEWGMRNAECGERSMESGWRVNGVRLAGFSINHQRSTLNLSGVSREQSSEW